MGSGQVILAGTQDDSTTPSPAKKKKKPTAVIKFLCACMFSQPHEKIVTGIVFKAVSNGA